MDQNDQHMRRNLLKTDIISNSTLIRRDSRHLQLPSSPHITDRSVVVIGTTNKKKPFDKIAVKLLSYVN